MTGYVTRSVLCLPLFRPYDASRPGGGAGAPPMGVVQFINKLAATTTTTTTAATAASDDEPADKDHALRLAEKRAVRAAVEDLEDLELASGFGKIASRAIATAIDHDEDRKAREEMKEANKEEEKKANFQSHVESIFDFFERRLDFGGTQVSPGGMEAAHTAFKLKQREGELSVKMNAMIRGYLTRRKVVKELKKNGMIVRSITGAAREKTDTMRAKLKDQEKIRKRAAAEASDDALRAEADRAVDRARATAAAAAAGALLERRATEFKLERRGHRQNHGRRREAAEAAALAQDAEDAREAIREAVNVAAYEKEEKFAKNFSAKKVQGMARRRSSLIMVEKQREEAVAAAARATSRRSLFRSAIRKVWCALAFRDNVKIHKDREQAADVAPRAAELEELQGAESPSRTLAEHRRALAEQRRAAQPPPRTGVGNMGTFAPPRTGKVSKGALIAAHRGAYNADATTATSTSGRTVASTAPRAVSGAYGGGGRQGRIEAQLLAELRDDLAENDVPTLGRVDEALYTATPLASRATTPYSAAKLLTSQLLSTTDEGDDESNDGRRVYVQHAYHVPIDASVSGSVPSYYPARPSGDPIYVHSPHKDRWLSAHAGVVKKSFKNDKLYREARRNVSRLVRQNRRLEYTAGLERPATTRTTSLPSPRRA
ncbi:3',5'-cyclic-nucleotide phosphodiesterase [Aureococcus anophagefferens]|nr:3',5'-cyclic-nucleotide phosphodiesterase [Aureococcus anophagefferens]